MIECIACGKTTHPVQDFHPSGRIVDCCGNCMAPIKAAQQPVAAQPAQKAPQAAQVAVRRAFEPQDGSDIVATIKTRLGVARAELVRLEGVRSEVAMLERMLDAAGVVEMTTTTMPISYEPVPIATAH